MTGKTVYSKEQFTTLEAMCRERASLARSEMEYSLMKYWQAEAEEWKQLGCLTHSRKDFRTVSPTLIEQQKTTNANGMRRSTIAGASRFCEM
jgi:hypothetical protein